MGTIAIGSFAIPMIQVSAYICAKYSLRRTVIDPNKREPKSILSFRTQRTPVCIALAQAAVLKSFYEKAVEMFKDPKIDYRVRHAVAAIFKVTTVLHGHSITWSLGDRCGAQGLFEANQITAMNVSTYVTQNGRKGLRTQFALLSVGLARIVDRRR